MHTPLALCDMMQARIDVIFVFESLYDTGSMHMGIFILECGGIVEVMTDNYRPQLFILCWNEFLSIIIVVYITQSTSSIPGNTPTYLDWNFEFAFCKHALMSIRIKSRSQSVHPVILTKYMYDLRSSIKITYLQYWFTVSHRFCKHHASFFFFFVWPFSSP